MFSLRGRNVVDKNCNNSPTDQAFGLSQHHLYNLTAGKTHADLSDVIVQLYHSAADTLVQYKRGSYQDQLHANEI